MELGVTYVTVYAFAIDNFNRSPEEVDSLMELAEQKFRNMLWEGYAVTKRLDALV